MTEKKDTHEGWGGPRKAGKGKRIGRPKKASVMQRLDVRIPPSWVDAVTQYGGGRFSEGVRKIIQESGVVR